MQSKANTGSLAEKFDGFGAAPSDALWGQIESAIGQNEKKRRGIIWWWFGGASAAAIGLFLVYISVFNLPQNTSNNEMVNLVESDSSSNSITYEADQVNEDSFDRNNQVIEEYIKSDYEEKTITNQTVNDHEGMDGNNHEQLFSEDSNLKNEKNHLSVIDLDAQVSTDHSLELSDILLVNKTAINADLLPNCDYPAFGHHLIEVTPKFKPEWELAVGMTYFTRPDFFVQAKQENLDMMSQGPNTTVPSTTDPGNTNGLASISESTYSSTPLYGGHVKKNWNFNFSMGRDISPRWSWKTGLDFSQTSYTSHYTQNNDFVSLGVSPVTATSKISAISIPLGIQFDCVERSKYRLRTGLSYVNEFPIYQSSTMSDASVMSESKSVIKGYSGAVQLNVNNEFKVAKNMYLYLRPSYRMYTSQYVNSTIPLLKKVHWLGISAGLSWTL